MPQTLELIDVESERLDDVLRRVEQSLDEQDSLLIRRVFESYAYVSDLVEDKNTSIRRLRELFFGSRTEKSDAVTRRKTKKSGTGTEAGEASTDASTKSEAKPPAPGHCLAHARRRFGDVYERFPEPCRHLLEALSVVYHNDAVARSRQLSPEARLRFHQEASQPTMQDLHDWLTRQLAEKRVEPNSSLGGAITYMLKHWDRPTLFLRQAGAPQDNNVCERALKKAILHRKNALFYKTRNGAWVGDLFMSLIYTCQLNHANAFD